MKIVIAKAKNGDRIEFRMPADGEFICPVCGGRLVGDLPWEETSAGPSSDPICWIPTYDACPECATEYGYDDKISRDSVPGKQMLRWEELRIKWLDKLGWPEDKLKQLKDNLDADIEALKKTANKM